MIPGCSGLPFIYPTLQNGSNTRYYDMPKKRQRHEYLDSSRNKRQNVLTNPNITLDYGWESDKSNKDEDNRTGFTAGPLDKDVGQRPVFPISSKASQIIDGPPLNAMDYLEIVRKEALSRPAFVSAPENFKSTVPIGRKALISYTEDVIKSVDRSVFTNAKPLNPELSYSVNLEWHNAFMTQFKKYKGQAKEQELAKLHIELPQTFSKWRVFVMDAKNVPSSSLVSSFDHQLKIRLLGYFNKWVSSRISDELSCWIFAILLSLPDVIVGEEVAVLRDLSKKCILINSNPHRPMTITTKYTIDMIVSVVAHYYGQRDLVVNKLD